MSGRENVAGYEDATSLCHCALLQGSGKGLSPTSAKQATKSSPVELHQKETRRRDSVIPAGGLMIQKMKGLAWDATELNRFH